MPSKKDKTPIVEGKYYHIFNKAINKEKLFLSPIHYKRFLDLYYHYLDPFVHTYAYCLLPNHFHFLVQIKYKEEYIGNSNASNQFRKMFIKYACYFNIQTGRTGNLFRKSFKRLEIRSDDYLKELVFYIHSNPRKHRVVKNYRDYQFSSFMEIINQTNFIVDRQTTISWFNDLSELVSFHEYKTNERFLNWLAIEDINSHMIDSDHF